MRAGERGNVIMMLFGAVAMLGVVVAGTASYVQGPLSTTVKVTRASMAEGQIHIAARLAVLDSAEDPGDCDDDGFIEPKGYVEAAVGQPFPAGGGHMPMVGAAQSDPWGTPYGYCAWDMGQINDICPGNRRDGPGMHETDLEQQSRPVLAIISAGPDRTFDTECLDYNPSHPDGPDQRLVVTPPGSEDIVFTYTYAEARGASAGLWQLKPGDPTIATIDRDVEIGTGRLRFGTEDLWGGTLGDLNVALACDSPQHVNTMRFNPFENTIEVCRNDGGWGWEPLSGSSSELGYIALAGDRRRISASAGNHVCAVKRDGSVWCWGNGNSGRLGNGATSGSFDTPQAVSGGGSWLMVSAGVGHSCGVKGDGSAWCWGAGGMGQLGNGGGGTNSEPVKVTGESEWIEIAAGSEHSCGLKSDGSAWCWGSNWDGALGTGDNTDQNAPVPVVGDHRWVTLSTSVDHTCGIRVDGSAWCWGRGVFGQLGNGSAATSNTPVEVSGGASWVTISAGSQHTCGIQNDGSAWCWGVGISGRLGNGNTEGQNAPVAVAGDGVWVDISAGGGHSCGVQVDGSAWCWGAASVGRLGIGDTSEDRSVPSRVVGQSASFRAITSGSSHSCAVKADGSAWCWGNGNSGRLGNGGTENSSIPVLVDGFLSSSAGGLWSLHDNGDDIYYNSGKVGIGTASPEAALDVAGGIRLGDDSGTCTVEREGTIKYAPVPCPAGGVEVGGYCWYLGELNDSCGDVCTAVGEASSSAIQLFAGHNGTNENCEDVLDALAVPGSSVTNEAGNLGCGWDTDDGQRKRWTSTTHGFARNADVRRACACGAGNQGSEVALQWCDGDNWRSVGYDPHEVGKGYPSALLSDDMAVATGLFEETYDPYPLVAWTPLIGRNLHGQPSMGFYGRSQMNFGGMYPLGMNTVLFGMHYDLQDAGDHPTGMIVHTYDRIMFSINGDEYARFNWRGLTLSESAPMVKLPLLDAEPWGGCTTQRMGSIAMTTDGTLCTCTSSGWRNAANTAACSW